ncbi:lipid IV(A) 3-deoxy-D-manno-octulosonic acid transferase [Pseudomarimonas salicorniae]|uniref:3-deoxy-D-manno-octulosonic acid transferase n=1 Tax=Pseudomarimonas salicorniae TaxID=2933270 RepID=A0ABT0GCP3_9GAMM|nr:lipid IV(A) 3-deoxy-D-manno-octulosonic acid transferase [Lysobacter sp. CAU 1642]MCK7592300.1 lipid IV(A) 3-deoxy-D-manno-octulosonic acid transferase [Lysobacter sp. CAU 1642]
MPPLSLRHRFMRALYTFTMYLVTPVIIYRLAARGLRLRGYFRRWLERFGYFTPPPAPGAVWVHAVSVGEVNAASPLVDVLRQRFGDRPMVVTTVTPTGSDRVRQLWGEDIFHVYLPYDLPAAVRRFLDRIQPAIAVIMETEIWPNLYFECDRRGIPIVLANARLSEKSLRGYGPARPLASEAVQRVRMVAAQSQADAERFRSLGVKPQHLQVVGNLKFDLRLSEQIVVDARERRIHWGARRPVWIAASTHEGEEWPVIEAHARVLRRFPDALLLVAPRHPERFKPMAQLCRGHGFTTATRSEHHLPGVGIQCFIIDTLGELVPFLACADVAFVGGSIDPIGGHNVLEPMALGVPVLVGPHTHNFTEVTDLMLERGAGLRIHDADTLAGNVQQLFADAARRQAMGESAREAVASARGAVQRTLAHIEGIVGG